MAGDILDRGRTPEQVLKEQALQYADASAEDEGDFVCRERALLAAARRFDHEERRRLGQLGGRPSKLDPAAVLESYARTQSLRKTARRFDTSIWSVRRALAKGVAKPPRTQ